MSDLKMPWTPLFPVFIAFLIVKSTFFVVFCLRYDTSIIEKNVKKRAVLYGFFYIYGKILVCRQMPMLCLIWKKRLTINCKEKK